MTRPPARRVGWLVLAFILAELAVASPASAHTQLTGMQPPADATVSAPPATVVLSFDEPVQAAFAVVTVTGPDGRRVDGGPPAVRDATVTEAVSGLQLDGRYTVAYRVVSTDGHPVSGQLAFSLAGVAPPSTPPTSPTSIPPTSPTPTSPTPTSPTPSLASALAAPASIPVAATSPPERNSRGGLGWIVAAVGAAAIGGAAAMLIRRRGRP